jgi:hypothetical protein
LWFVLLLVAGLFLSGLSPAFAAWTAPVELSASEDSVFMADPDVLATSSLTVQEDGSAHIVYLEKTGKIFSIVHQTNKSGSWQKETVTSSTTRLSSPAVAVRKGRLYLVWVRGSKTGSEIVYATGAGGAWSSSRVTDNSVADLNPAIAVRGGKVYISWIEAKRLRRGGFVKTGFVRVKSNVSGRWRTETIGETYFEPGAPLIRVDRGGSAHVVYSGRTKRGGAAVILHADNIAGEWRQERLPVNVDRRGKIVSAEMPALALYKNSVYVAFVRIKMDTSGGPTGQIALAVKKNGAWRVRAVTKGSDMLTADAPRIAVGRGRIRLAYTRLGFGPNFELTSQARYLELADGRARGEAIESESFAMDPFAPNPPPITVFMMTGLEDVQGLVHATYLKVTLDLAAEKMSAKLLYSVRHPD